MTGFLITMLLAAIVPTIALNVLIRAFPGTSAEVRARQLVGEEPPRVDEMPPAEDRPRVRFYFPWRQMLGWSLALTLLLNLLRVL